MWKIVEFEHLEDAFAKALFINYTVQWEFKKNIPMEFLKDLPK